jgi:hypothetical protein
MAMTLFERGRQEGRLEGLIQGQRKLLVIQLEERFGPLSAAVQEHVQSLSAERLTDLGRALLKAQTLRELGLEE